MRIFRCPRCRAEDISADAHPARVLDNGVERPFFVCRNCYRAAELEFRIACQTADVGYVPLAIRDGLALLRDFYCERIAEYAHPRIDAKRYPGAHSGASAPYFVARGRASTVKVNTKPYRLPAFTPLIALLRQANARVELDPFWSRVAAGEDVSKKIALTPRSRL